MQVCLAGKTGGRRHSHLFLIWSQSRSVTWKNNFSLCLRFPQRKQCLQLVSMAAVLQWIQSGWKVLLLDCVRGDFSPTHILRQFERLHKLLGKREWDPLQLHRWRKQLHPSYAHLLKPEPALFFPNSGLLNSSPANSLCHISPIWANNLSALHLWPVRTVRAGNMSRGSFTIPGDEEGCEQQSVSHVFAICKTESNSRVQIKCW